MLQEIFWANTKNRKLFFNEFAKNKQFDPLLASNWYNVTSHDIRAMNVYHFIIFDSFLLFIIYNNK